MSSFFFCKLQLITVLFLISDMILIWAEAQGLCGIFHFRFRLIFIKDYIFLQ